MSADTDDETVSITRSPLIEVVKTADKTTAEVGSSIVYGYTITNTGNVTLTGVTLTDDKITGAITLGATTLAPGASTTGTATHVVTEADLLTNPLVNIATATGTPPTGSNVTDTDTKSVALTSTPLIDIVKTGVLNMGSNSRADAGDMINYTFTVTNTGNVTLTGVTVTDPKLTVLGGPITLAKNAVDSTTFTGTYALTQADIDAGKVDNTATATGTPPTGVNVTDTDDETVSITRSPLIEVVKTADKTTAEVGSSIVYGYTITNTGNVTLTGVTLTDDKITGAITLGATTLAPGASTTGTATHVVTEADLLTNPLVNIATATGTPPTGSNVTDTDTKSVALTSTPLIDIVKTGVLNMGSNSRADAGDVINYTFTVTNTGNVTLTA